MSEDCKCKECVRGAMFRRIINENDFLAYDKEFLEKLMSNLCGAEFDNAWHRIEREKFVKVYKAAKAMPNPSHALESAMTLMGWHGIDESIQKELGNE